MLQLYYSTSLHCKTEQSYSFGYGTYGVKPATQAPTEKKEEAFVAPDVQDGSVVVHKTFGEGTVTKIDKAQKHSRITFTVGEKTFIFPDAFKMGFLKMKGE